VIKLPFGVASGVEPINSMLDGGPDGLSVSSSFGGFVAQWLL